MKRGLCKRKFRNCSSKFIFIREYNYQFRKFSKTTRTDSLRAIYIVWNIVQATTWYPLAAIVSKIFEIIRRRIEEFYFHFFATRESLKNKIHLNLYSIRFNNELLIIFNKRIKNSTVNHRMERSKGKKKKERNFRAEKDYYGARSSEEDDTDSKERISHRHWPSAAFPTLLYACIIYRWCNECYVFGTVLIDEETITAYREQDASLVMICVICRARRTHALPKRWWNARTYIYTI